MVSNITYPPAFVRVVSPEHVNALLAARSSAIIDLGHPVLQQMWREHCGGAVDNGHKLWNILSLALWEKRVLR